MDIFTTELVTQTYSKIYDQKFKQQLQQLAQQEGIGLQTIFFGAFCYALKMLTYQEDILLGLVSNNRPTIEDGDKILGCFLNTLPFRFDLANYRNENWQSYFKGIDTKLNVLKNKGRLTLLEIAKLVEEQAGDDNPFFDVMFNYADFHIYNNLDETADTELKLDIESFERTNTFLDLNVFVNNQEIGILYKLDRALKMPVSLEKLHLYVEQIIELYLNEGERKTVDCPLLSTEEKAIIQGFNDTTIEYEQDKTILDLYKEQLAKRPDAIVIKYEDKQVSFAELDELSNKVAAYLLEEFEVKPNDLIGLQLERSEWMLICILGILKTGGAYVPIDTNYPIDKVRYIKEDSGYKVCINSEVLIEIQSKLPELNAQVALPKVNLDTYAYGIYTSGSTGNPKGVINNHAGLYNRLLWMRDDLQISEQDVLIQKTPYTFDVSVWELTMPLITGSQLVFAKVGGHKDPDYLYNLIEKEKVNVMHFVPSMLGAFLGELEAEKCKSLKHVVCSGEALPRKMVEQFRAGLPWARIHNLYGPTEAAIDVTSIDVTTVDLDKNGVTIGYPVANTEIYIANPSMQLQGIGVPGELLIGGIQVSQGYLNRPELNAAKFIPNPFGEGKAYRTGDLAKWLPDGNIVFLGRMDHQVKIRGNRIELGEIETALDEMEMIGQSVVMVRENEAGNKQLVAYVLRKANYDKNQVYEHLTNKLPEYMIPSFLIDLEEFPTTANGKLNRKALPKITMGLISGSTYKAPSNETEEKLVEIWEGILKEGQVGVEDNFFQIGGDSIVSIRTVSRINKVLETDIKVGDLYEQKTIANLSKLIEQAAGGLEVKKRELKAIETQIDDLKSTVLANHPQAKSIVDVYPMGDIQKGMVLLSLVNPGTALYHDQFLYQVPKVDITYAEKALDLIVAKHQSLRTAFDLENYDEQVQLVFESIDYKIHEVDLNHLTKSEQEQHIMNYLVEERGKPFDIKKAPLWRLTIFHITEETGIFLVQFHHSILDGWSLASLNTELFNTYLALQEKSDIQLEPLAINGKAAIIEELYEKKNQDNIQYWQKDLEDFKRLDIFSDEPSTEQYTQTYTKDFRQQLEQLRQRDGISLQTIFSGAFCYALKMLTYQEDILFGLVSNNRPILEDGDKLLGCFLNTLPFRFDLSAYRNESWKAYFKGIDQKLNVLKTRGRLTLLEIAKLAEEQTAEENPFFDVMFNYVDFHIYNDLNEAFDTELKLDVEFFEKTNTALDFTVSTTINEVTFLYKLDRTLKVPVSLEKLHHYVVQIIEFYIKEEERKTIDCPLLSAEDKAIIDGFNNTAITYEQGKTILDLYQEQLTKRPEAIAIKYLDKEVSFAELEKLSNKVAAYLLEEYKASPNDLIGIQLERSEWMLISILGIMKVGAAYVPIDTHYPIDRVNYIQKDSGYKVCINAEVLIDIQSKLDILDAQVALPKINPDTYAYAIYTSGSTGNPKGVINNHAGLYNRLLWMRDDLQISEQDVLIQKTPYTFDVSVWELTMPLITGSQLVFAKAEGHKDPYYLQDLIEKEKVNIIHFVPSMLGAFLGELEEGRCGSLQHIVCSGEALPQRMVEQFRLGLPQAKIHNLYGPTEAAIDVTSIDLTSTDLTKDGVTIGHPVANTAIYIVNPSMQLQDIAVPGELLIGGIQVSQGYLNRPELNAAKFIPNPFGEGRVYRTGDLAKWLPDGNIAFLGRMDHQVKIRGNRIELGEIETALDEMEMIGQSVVLVRENEEGNKQLVAYVLRKTGYDKNQVYEYLGNKLPEYMIPTFLIDLEEFPTTTNGKLNRKALPEVTMDLASGSTYKAPSNEMETKLVEIWENVLKREQIGTEDNFFQIGGDSIISIRAVSRINKKLGTDVKVVDLYEQKTISNLSKLIEQDAGEGQEAKKREIKIIENQIDDLKSFVLANHPQAESIADVYPMGDIQKGMVLLSLVNPDEAVYHDQFLYEVPKVDIVYFEQALDLMISKHESLRTSFDLENYGEQLQIVFQSIDYKIHERDISHLPKTKQEEYIKDYLVLERKKPFNIRQTPLWRPAIFHISEETSIFLMQFHHAILDGWSLASFNTELFSTYIALQENADFQLKPLATNGKAAIIEELYEKKNEENIQYWLKELNEYKRLDIFSNEEQQIKYNKEYDHIFVNQLHQQREKDGLQLKTILFGSIVYALNALSIEDDLTVGLVSNNRPVIEDGDKILGCFLNTLPFRIQLDKSLSWTTYFKNIEQKITEFNTSGRLTLLEIAKKVGERTSDENPFFDVLFNYIDFHIYNDVSDNTENQAPTLDLEPYESTNTFFDIDVIKTANGLDFHYELSRKLKSNIRLEQIHGYVEIILNAYLNQANSPLDETALIGDIEREQLLTTFNDTDVKYSNENIIDLFQNQVKSKPNKTALVCNDTELSYQKLDTLSNQFSNYLLEQQDVQAEDFVAIHIERSEWMIVSILATLKTGATYIPIAFDTPQDRVDYILKDSKAKCIINEKVLNEFNAQQANISDTKEIKIDKDSLAYIIYTSGSTGRPKGVMISHESLVDYVQTTKEYFNIKESDKAIQQASIAFDTSIEEIFPILIAGGTLYIQVDKKDINGLIEECVKNKITFLSTNPYVLKYLNDNLSEYPVDFTTIISGGDTLKYDYVDNIIKKYPVYNTYGPTESTVCASYYKIQEGDTIIPIGKAINNRKLYILGYQNELLPIGVAGELCISGKGLARGYSNQSELTESKFIEHPFIEGERLYKTGDIARYLTDGNIEFLGRKDEQIKIRGNRIELGEIEQQLLKYEGIDDAVITTQGNAENLLLVAYYTASKPMNHVDLTEYLDEILPSYMIPTFYMHLEHLPLNANGKIDKKALPEIEIQQTDNYKAPSNPTEEKLVDFWVDLLNLDKDIIGVNNNFFELGGHSLKVVTLVSKIEKEFNVKIKLQNVFASPTIKEIAKTIIVTQLTRKPKKAKLKFTI